MNFIRKNTRETVIFCIVMLITQLLFAGGVIEYCGKKIFLALLVAVVIESLAVLLMERKISESLYSQLAVVGLIMFLFIGSSMMFKSDVINIKSMYIIFYLIFSTSAVILCNYITHLVKKAGSFSAIKSAFIENKWIILLLAVVVISRLPYIEMLQRWDSGEYYWRFSLAAEKFKYTGLEEYMDTFSLCGHPTLAFSFIYLIGELAFPDKIIGVSIISLIMTVAAVWCVYKIFLKVFAKTNEKQAALCAFILSAAPLFYSTSAYFNPDYAMSLFIIFAVYSYVYNKALLAGVFSFFCFQTKETGLVLICGLVIGVFVQHFLERRQKGFFKSAFTDLRLWTTLAATIVQLGYYMNIGGMSDWSQNGHEEPGIRWDSNGENCLGFNIDFIAARLKQQFVLNFNWLVTLVIVVSIILLIVYKIKQSKTDEINGYGRVWNDNSLCGIVGAFMALLSFSCLFITSSVARYNVPGDILLYIIMMYLAVAAKNYAIPCIFGKTEGSRLGKYVFRAAAGAFTVLIVIQSFWTIDPVTKLAFTKLDAVSADIYYVGKQTDGNNVLYYGDYLIYNTQYQYIDKVYDEMLRELDYEPGKFDIVLPDDNGCFITGNMYRLNWDKKREKRVFYSNENTVAMENYVLTRDIDRERVSSGELKEEAIMVVNPFWLHIDKTDALKAAGKWYNIGEEKIIGTSQGSIIYYNMTLK